MWQEVWNFHGFASIDCHLAFPSADLGEADYPSPRFGYTCREFSTLYPVTKGVTVRMQLCNALITSRYLLLKFTFRARNATAYKLTWLVPFLGLYRLSGSKYTRLAPGHHYFLLYLYPMNASHAGRIGDISLIPMSYLRIFFDGLSITLASFIER